MAVVHEPDFGAARDLFALYCKAKGLSARTLETYLASIDELGTFLAQSDRGDGIPLPQDIRAFVASLLDRSLARTAISIRLRSVRCFFNFLAREETEQEALLAQPNPCYPTGKRNRPHLRLMLDTGPRLSEATALRWRDIDLTTGKLMVRQGKGAKDRTLWIGDEDLTMLRG